MTTCRSGRNSGSRALLLLAGLLAASLSARAQDDREITEEMKRLCPALETAEGRRREQLLLLYFDLDPTRAHDPKQAALVREHFDLARAEDVELLRAELLDAPKPKCLGGV